MNIENISDLLDVIKTAEDNLRERDNRIQRYRALYNMDHYSPIAVRGLPPEYHRALNKYAYQSNDATNIVDLTVGILSHNNLKLEAYTYKEQKDSNRAAGEIERLVAGVIKMNCIEQEVDIHNDIIHNMTIDGGCGLRTIWSEHGIAERITLDHPAGIGETSEPTEVDVITEVPIRLDVIPLENMLYIPGGPHGRWFMIGMRDKRTIDSIREEFPDYRAEIIGPSLLKTEVTFYDMWFWGKNDQDKIVVMNAIVADKEVLRPPTEMPGYADLPYTLAFFKPTQDKKIENWGLSMLSNVEEDIRMLENRINHQNRMLDIWANLPLFSKTRDNRAIDVDAVFGTVVNLGTDESVGFIQPGGEPPDHDKILNFAKQSISNGSYPPVAFGQGAGASGYGLSQLAEGGRIRLEQPRRQIELMWEVAIWKMLGLFRNYAPDRAMRVFGEYKGEPFVMNDLVGKDTEGWFVSVKLDPRFPQDEARMAALGNQLLAIKGISRRTAQERYFGIDDPDREQDRLLVEAAQTNPDLMQALIQEALKAYGIDMPQGQAPSGSPPRLPISQPLMSNPEQGVLPPQAAGGQPYGQETAGDPQRLLSMLSGASGG